MALQDFLFRLWIFLQIAIPDFLFWRTVIPSAAHAEGGFDAAT